jgi:putative transposase
MKYRLYPTPEQECLLSKAFGCARFAYNWAIGERKSAYANGEKTPTKFDLNARMTKLKKELPWLGEVSDWVLKESIADAVKAYDNFFAHRAKFPRFKRKNSSVQTARWRRPVVKGRNHVMIPKIGVMMFREHRPLDGVIKTVTICRSSSGRYHISFLVDDGLDKCEKPDVVVDSVGIDVGLADFAIMSTGEKVANPRFGKRHERRIKGLQRKLARQKKGSKRYYVTRQKLAREYEKMVDERRAFLHELSTKLVRENQAIAVEDLNVSGMLKNHKLANAISDVSWSEFFGMLEYKCDWYGVHLMKCDRWEPTSKTCSECGHRMGRMPLSVRSWVCPECGTLHDRDVNAAMNILSAASVEYGRGGQVSPSQRGTARRSVKPTALAVG